jgi:uncharacterized protein (TIGR01777 family)
MNILVSGSRGLIASALIPLLGRRGHRVIRLVRPPSVASADQIVWNPAAGEVDAPRLEGIDAVIHLAGEPIPAIRWTADKKARISDSRVRSTRLLAETLAGLSRRPGVLLCASAVGYYGDRGDETLSEESPPGSTFLAGVCRDWEAAADPAREAGIRVVHLRNANVFAAGGGYLGPLLLLFRFGLGGRLGDGRQYLSWIAIDDWIEAVYHVLGMPSLRGPVNLTAPEPVTNREFTQTLARVLRRPAPFVAPALVLRLVMGELGGELLQSARMHPGKLVASGYVFRYPQLEGALRHLLGRD